MQAIREAGVRLIYEHGYEGMNLRQLAEEVGIQAGSLYNHIHTKQDLLFELVKEHLAQLLTQLDAALAGIEGPVERMEAFCAFHVNYHMVRKREVSVVNFELRSLEPANYQAVVAMRRAYERPLIAIIEAGIASGDFAPTDARVAAFAILALLTSVCTWYRPNGRLNRDEIVAVHTQLVLNGLKAGAVPVKRVSRPKPARSSKPARGAKRT
ncbi:MAG TPA: TetR/AcrR family transcriptional regulator [Magnetospirillaceae bacterium]|jgi:AcrR family transcriptional regulator